MVPVVVLRAEHGRKPIARRSALSNATGVVDAFESAVRLSLTP